ncbi:MAG: urease accessory protein UreD [Rhodospirillales bacterium]|nr:urease accessory protein UreD [Rhodospirillales bacterium]
MDGKAVLRVKSGGPGGRSRLADLYMHDPLRVLFPRPAEDEPMTAVLATTSGGLVGGDRLAVEVAAEAGTRLQVVGQAAEKIYRSLGPDTEVSLSISVSAGSLVELLPQGTILFNGARLKRQVAIDAAEDATVLTGEIVTLGRIASGERVTHGLLHDRWAVRRDGRLVWADALLLDGDIGQTLALPVSFDNAVSLGTVVHVGPGAAQGLELARALLESVPETVRAGTSLVNGLLIARFLSADAAALRAGFGRFWKRYRAGACALPERMPTIWNV